MKKASTEIQEIYGLFQKAFIPAELRLYSSFCSLFEQNAFQIYIEQDNNKVIGAVIVWELNDFIYLENFAVEECARGQGIGGNMLETIKTLYPHHTIVLEVEPPKDEITQRRIVFYQRHQWVFNQWVYQQPLLRENVQPVYLHIMSYPQALNQEKYHQIIQELLIKVYQQKGEL